EHYPASLHDALPIYTHTDEAGQLDHLLADAAKALTAFMTDLGATRRHRVTVAVMTEFGRRVAMNDGGGADHGHGAAMWLLGGGRSEEHTSELQSLTN